jgi:hypothetical protein
MSRPIRLRGTARSAHGQHHVTGEDITVTYFNCRTGLHPRWVVQLRDGHIPFGRIDQTKPWIEYWYDSEAYARNCAVGVLA